MTLGEVGNQPVIEVKVVWKAVHQHDGRVTARVFATEKTMCPMRNPMLLDRALLMSRRIHGHTLLFRLLGSLLGPTFDHTPRLVGTLRRVDTPHRGIQFTTTEDGFGIAYWEIGSGLPLIVTHNRSLSHAELEWTVPSIASFLVALSERYRVIRFDPRGQGLVRQGVL